MRTAEERIGVAQTVIVVISDSQLIGIDGIVVDFLRSDNRRLEKPWYDAMRFFGFACNDRNLHVESRIRCRCLVKYSTYRCESEGGLAEDFHLSLLHSLALHLELL